MKECDRPGRYSLAITLDIMMTARMMQVLHELKTDPATRNIQSL